MVTKVYDKNVRYGTSFFGETIAASKADLIELFGEPVYTKDFSEFSKTYNEWVFKTDEGFIFTLYDYNEDEYNDYEVIDWHIGAKNRYYSEKAKSIVHNLLNEMYNF